jgi:hypothetical protein
VDSLYLTSPEIPESEPNLVFKFASREVKFALFLTARRLNVFVCVAVCNSGFRKSRARCRLLQIPSFVPPKDKEHHSVRRI